MIVSFPALRGVPILILVLAMPALGAGQQNSPAKPRARDLNELIRYTMWSVPA